MDCFTENRWLHMEWMALQGMDGFTGNGWRISTVCFLQDNGRSVDDRCTLLYVGQSVKTVNQACSVASETGQCLKSSPTCPLKPPFLPLTSKSNAFHKT